MGASVVSCGNAPPVFELGEHILDFVALFIERLVIVDCQLSVLSARDTWRDAPCGRLITEPVAVVAAISDECLGPGQLLQYLARSLWSLT